MTERVRGFKLKMFQNRLFIPGHLLTLLSPGTLGSREPCLNADRFQTVVHMESSSLFLEHVFAESI